MPRNLCTPPAEKPCTTPSRVTAIGARECPCAQALPGSPATPNSTATKPMTSERRPRTGLKRVNTVASPSVPPTGPGTLDRLLTRVKQIWREERWAHPADHVGL